MTFFLNFIVSFIEVIAWGLYMDGYYEVPRFYFTTIGYWGSVIFYAIPFLFELIHIIYRGAGAFPGTWAVFHMVMSFAIWMTAGLLHIFYVDDFIVFMDSRDRPRCICSAPEILPIDANADKETRLAWDFAIAQRKKICALQCPIIKIEEECGLDRLDGQSDIEYELACEALRRETKLQNIGSGTGDEEYEAESEAEDEGW